MGNSISLVFFGFYCLLLGWLVPGAKFLPGIFGVLLILTGTGRLIGNFTLFLAPDAGNPLSRIRQRLHRCQQILPQHRHLHLDQQHFPPNLLAFFDVLGAGEALVASSDGAIDQTALPGQRCPNWRAGR